MKKKALVVGGPQHIARLIEVNLLRANFEVATACDIREAWEQIQVERPDFVVLDVMTPSADFCGLLQTLRKNPSTRDLPVLMLTGKAQDADVFRGWLSGMGWLLNTPNEKDEKSQ